MSRLHGDGLNWPIGFNAYWDRPMGVVGKATSTSTQAVGAAADVTSLTTTFTASANRVYKVEWLISGMSNVSGSTAGCNQSLFVDGAQVASLAVTIANNFNQGGAGVYYTTSLTSASHTIKMQISSSVATTMTSGATTPHILIVTDVGPA